MDPEAAVRQDQNFRPYVPPNDAEAELEVLAGMMFAKDAIAAACETLGPDDFYRPENKAMFEAMEWLFNRNVPVDYITLCDRLAESGALEQIGGRERVGALAAASYTSVNVRHHARIVSEKSTLRKLIKASNEIFAACGDAREPVAAIIDRAEKSIFEISNGRGTGEFVRIDKIIAPAIEKLDQLRKNQGTVIGVETGFADFDRKTAGMQPSDLILIGSRPSMGKTSLLLNIAQHAAIKKNVTTALFSLEMSKEQLFNRILSSEASIDAQKIRIGNLSSDDMAVISKAVIPISMAPLYIDETPAITVSEVRAKCRRLKTEKNLGLIVIDYLQLMSGQNARSESRQMEISEISRSLKGLAKELNVPVLTAAQLSRACEARTDKRPLLSDLRESGAIEQDADVVAFLYREEYYNPKTEKLNHAELIIAKQRNGPTGTVELTYRGEYTKFANMERFYA